MPTSPSGTTRPTTSVRFHPAERAVGDCMPFFHDGEYHVFYLLNNAGNQSINWEHAVSTDLVHWRDLPPAIEWDPEDASGPEGGCMFTGSVILRDDVFHAFYTSWNPDNPDGREFICHATSTDLVTWTKHPEDMIAPDGIHYADHQARDFRDPDVVWDERRGEYVMYILGNRPGGQEWVFGVLTSQDLTTWTQHPPIEGIPGDECPDVFSSGETYYLHSCRFYATAPHPDGPWRYPEINELDRSMAAKRVFDGRRHVWIGGWLGGPMCLPREVVEGPNGTLAMKPVTEAVAAFEVVHASATDLRLSAESPWSASVPVDYLLEGTFVFGDGASLSLTVRGAGGSGNRRLVLSPRDSEVLATGGDTPESRQVPFGETPTSIQAFVVGGIAEVFVDSRYAATFTIHDEGGTLTIEAEGDVVCRTLQVRAPSFTAGPGVAEGGVPAG